MEPLQQNFAALSLDSSLVDWMKQFQLQPVPQTSFDQFTEAQYQEFQKMVFDFHKKKA